MSSDFKPKAVSFTLKDVGSAIIDQLATDVHTNPGSILRELVKNAYDSYLDLPPEIVDEDEFERQVIISRGELGGKRFIQVADHGIGLGLEELKAFVQISISPKTEREGHLPTTGFRGLGSWAMVAGGSAITIISTKLSSTSQCRLDINVNEIYSLLGPETTLEDILNNKECVAFSERSVLTPSHGTIVQIQCDGPPKIVHGHELNRLYEYTNKNDEGKLKKLVVDNCSLPYSKDTEIGKKINEIYLRAKYVPTDVILDGDTLKRSIPPELTEFRLTELKVSGTTLALAWTVEHPTKPGKIEIDNRYLVNGPSIQLTKYNVPVGPKGLHDDDVRSTMPSWYLGEVHILAPEVQPNANGDGLRGGTSTELFITQLKAFYKELETRGEEKSLRESAITKLERGIAAAERLVDQQTQLSDAQKIKSQKEVLDAIERLDARDVLAITDARLQETLKRARKQFKKTGDYERFSQKQAKANAKKGKAGTKKKAATNSPAGKTANSQTMADLQKKFGVLTLKLKAFGLGDRQIEEIVLIVTDMVS